jgi:acyl-CoA synthetase (AMP-forming)/AMP-acid ligase II
MPSSTVQALRARLPGLKLFNIYGMTETAGVIAALPDGEFAAHSDSVGRAVPGMEIRVLDEAGAASDSGELLVRGPTVTDGYWHDPDATAEAITDGWLRTGDAVHVDSDGYLHVLGRITDMINRGGVKISPADIEHALSTHPDVAAAAAVGIPDGLAGEAVAAAVVPADGVTLDLRSLRAFVRPLLPVHARPKRLRIATELPRNEIGKLDRAALRAMLTQADQ